MNQGLCSCPVEMDVLPHPVPLPRGEGAQRAGEGIGGWFMAPIASNSGRCSLPMNQRIVATFVRARTCHQLTVRPRTDILCYEVHGLNSRPLFGGVRSP